MKSLFDNPGRAIKQAKWDLLLANIEYGLGNLLLLVVGLAGVGAVSITNDSIVWFLLVLGIMNINSGSHGRLRVEFIGALASVYERVPLRHEDAEANEDVQKLVESGKLNRFQSSWPEIFTLVVTVVAGIAFGFYAIRLLVP